MNAFLETHSMLHGFTMFQFKICFWKLFWLNSQPPFVGYIDDSDAAPNSSDLKRDVGERFIVPRGENQCFPGPTVNGYMG